MLSSVFDFLITLFSRCIAFLFDLQLSDSGISLGWFIIGAFAIGLCIKLIFNPLYGKGGK